MSDKIYKKDDILNRLNSYLKDDEVKLECWENVKRLTKKDGSNFVVLSKNFSNCKIVDEYLLNCPQLKVSIFKNHAYFSDELEIYGYCDKLEKTDPRYRPNEGCLRSHYILTVDEILKSIEDRKEWLKKRIEELKQEIKATNKAVKKADSIIKEIKTLLNTEDLQEANNKYKYSNSLGYAIRDYIKNNIY